MGEWKPFHEGCGNNKRISNEVRGILEDKNLKYFKAMTQDAAENVKLTFLGASPLEIPLQKLAYATICGVHTVFFSKRRKNSSLCAHRVAAWIENEMTCHFNNCYLTQLSCVCSIWDASTRI